MLRFWLVSEFQYQQMLFLGHIDCILTGSYFWKLVDPLQIKMI